MAPTKVAAGVVATTVLLVAGALVYKKLDRQRGAELDASRQRQGALLTAEREIEEGISKTNQRAAALEEENRRLVAAVEKAEASARAAVTAQAGPEMRYKRAQQLLRNGRLDAALEDLLWCYDVGMAENPAYRGIRNSSVPNLLGEIAKTYAPARVALQERRDLAEQRMLATPNDPSAASAAATLNRALGETTRNVTLFDQLPATDSRRQALLYSVFDQLLEGGRYRDIVSARSPAQMNQQFERAAQTSPSMSSPPDAVSLARMAAYRQFIVKATISNIEALAGAGALDEARRLAEKVLRYDGSDGTKTLLRERAQRAGQPDLFETLSQ